jgi:eight-cysteine-cluster-containing protein
MGFNLKEKIFIYASITLVVLAVATLYAVSFTSSKPPQVTEVSTGVIPEKGTPPGTLKSPSPPTPVESTSTPVVVPSKDLHIIPTKHGGKHCVITGCSGEICSDRDMASACVYRDVYSCYRQATCEIQSDGACGWTYTPELQECINAHNGEQI